MNDDLTAFRTSASTMRSGEARAFDGDFVTFKHDSGEWLAGKAKTDLSGRRLVAAVFHLILAWQKYQDQDGKSGKYVYAGAGFVRDNHKLVPREQLDERNKDRWKNDQDPWAPTYYSAKFDPETREQFVWTTNSGGGKDALAVLQDAFADHNEGRALTDYEWPIVELGSDWYINSYKKKIFKPILDNVGWCKPPAAFRLPKPPATSTRLRVIKPGEVPSPSGDPDDEIPF
jgi:hypothetical protein